MMLINRKIIAILELFEANCSSRRKESNRIGKYQKYGKDTNYFQCTFYLIVT